MFYQHIVNILELPGLSIIIKKYMDCSIIIDNKSHINRIQFTSILRVEVKDIFCYGNPNSDQSF